jgi:hypothetical protein
VDMRSLLRYLAARLQGEDNAEHTVHEGRGILLRGLPSEDALMVRSDLKRRGMDVVLVAEDHPTLLREPVEALSLQVKGESLVLSSQMMRVRVTVNDVAIVHCATMKLSPKSPNYRRVVEVIAAPDFRRVQLWERTLIPAACIIDDDSLPVDSAFFGVFRALCARVRAEALTSAALRARTSPQQLVRFDSFQAYENYMTYCILTRLGEKLP